MEKEIQDKIYVFRINRKDQSYHKTLETAKLKLKEKKYYYDRMHFRICKETKTSFEALLMGWDSTYNCSEAREAFFIDIKEIKLED